MEPRICNCGNIPNYGENENYSDYDDDRYFIECEKCQNKTQSGCWAGAVQEWARILEAIE